MSLKRARRIKGINRKNTRRRKPTITRTAIRKANQNRKKSSLELALYAILDDLDVQYTKEKAIGRCHVDIFFEPDVVVEAQGCYWHGCKQCFPEPTKQQLKARKKDKNRYKFFESRGLEVIEIWEHEVEEAPDEVKKLLKVIGPKKK